MEDWVPELVELVEDKIEGVLLQLPALVVDLFDVRLAPRGGDDLRADLFEPFKAFPRHAFGQDRNSRAIQQRAIKRAAATIVPRGRPDRLVGFGVEFAAYQARDQAAKGSADLMRAGGKEFARQTDDARLHAGDGGWDFEVVHPAV